MPARASCTSRRAMAPTTMSWASPTASRCLTRWPRTAPYYPHVPLFAGKRVYTPEGKKGDANRTVIAADRRGGQAGLASGRITHSYPHSWRSKAPVIFRNAPQWFIAMDKQIPEIGGTLARKGAGGDRRDALRAARRLQSPALDDRDAARLERLAPARLGRADRGVRRQADRRAVARRRGDGPRRRSLPHRRRRCLVRQPGARALPRQQVQCPATSSR
jgi:hypothetical protein